MTREISSQLRLGALILTAFSCVGEHEVLSGEYKTLADFEKRLSKLEDGERRVLEQGLERFRIDYLEKISRALAHDDNEAANLKAARLEVLDAAWKRIKLIEPVVKVEGGDYCASGVVIWKREVTESLNEYLVLTSCHVLNNILSDSISETRKTAPFQVSLKRNGKEHVFRGSLAEKSQDFDLGLISFRTREDFAVASLVSEETFGAIDVLEPIYAVGYPLCEGPIPTRGEISSVSASIKGKRFYLITANAYFGNSGGGVFLANSNKLIGIFGKIYIHGSGDSRPITHMGLMIPFDIISNWLQSSGYGFVIPAPEFHPVSRRNQR